MKKHFKEVVWMAAIGMMTLMTGCSSVFTPIVAGNATGKAIYIGYTKVSENKSAEFKQKVVDIWNIIDKIETKDQLVSSMNLLDKKFEELLASKELSASDIEIVKALYATVADKVKVILADSLTSNDQALEFLIGVRQGINDMIKLYNIKTTLVK